MRRMQSFVPCWALCCLLLRALAVLTVCGTHSLCLKRECSYITGKLPLAASLKDQKNWREGKRQEKLAHYLSFGEGATNDIRVEQAPRLRRELLQDRDERQQRECVLSRSEQQRLYDSSTTTWTLDSDYLSLRENDVQPLIDCVADSETVVVLRGLVLNMTKTLAIERSIRIEGENSKGEPPKWTCGSSRGRDQIVVIRGAENVTLSGIHFVNCDATQSLAPIVVRNSDVTFSNCQFEDNHGENGGVILARGSRLQIHDSVFRRNQADGNGGCIHVRDSTIVVRGCVFEENSSVDLGGALMLANVTVSRVLQSHFLRNEARAGGAISGSSRNQSSELTVDGCTFNRNQADVRGGAITLVGMEASISASSFRRNNGSAGGALYFQSLNSSGSSEPTILRITGCNFTRNNASSIGGAVLLQGFIEVRASTVSFVRNNAGVDGGAIALQSEAALTHLNANETGLEAILSLRDGVCERNSASHGGCLSAVNESTVQLTNFNISSNSALNNGGGLRAEHLNALTFMNVNFSDNQAAGHYGGGAFISSDLVEDRETNISTIGRTRFIIKGCKFDNNRALVGAGLCIHGYISVSVEDSEFVLNTQVGGGRQVSSTTNRLNRGGSAGIHTEASGYERADSFNTMFNIQSRGINVKEVLDQARASLESPSTENSESLVPVLSMTINNSVFNLNHALASSGAISAMSGCLLWVEHTQFVNNRAEDVSGGIYIEQSLFFCKHCVFYHNQAGWFGGAFQITDRSIGDDRDASATEGHFRHSLFVNNSAGIEGGAVAVDGLETYFFSLENVTYRSNKAPTGGAITSAIAARVVVRTNIFDQNRANVGGALSMSFFRHRQNRFEINDAVFTENAALSGGAIYAEYYASGEHHGEIRLFFDDFYIHPLIQLNNTVLIRNSATDGGALYLKSVRALLRNVTMERNNVSGMGGACALTEGSAVLAIHGRFHGNEAASGGAISVGARSMLHCIRCEMIHNVASNNGGGMLAVMLLKPPFGVQCDACLINHNRAQLGGVVTHMSIQNCVKHATGALYVLHGSDVEESDAHAAVVVLRDTEPSNNHAEIGGGGIMASHPDFVVLDCLEQQIVEPTPSNISEGFLETRQTTSMQRLSERSCPSWRGNSIGPDGYGAEKATFASRTVVCVMHGDQCRVMDGRLHAHRSTGRVPPIRITLVDHFEQQPAAPWPDQQFLLASIELSEGHQSVVLSGQLNALVEGGEAIFRETTVTGPPGPYGILLNFSDGRIPDIALDTELQSCLVGEQSVLGDTACQACEAGGYRVQEPLDVCKDCPEHCVCNNWGIAPARNYWIPSPCSIVAEECLSDSACEYGTFNSAIPILTGCCEDKREEALDAFFSEVDPSCDVSESSIEDFRRIQCSEGYEGLRCGTCSDGYGSFMFDCRRCMRRILIYFLFVLNALWFLVLCGVAIRGNLIKNDSLEERLSALRGNSTRTKIAPIEMRVIGGEAKHLLHIQSSQSAHLSINTTQYNYTKRNIAERFKLLVNFAQVNAMALSINTKWTRAIQHVLRSLDSIGAVSAEAAISLDCLFSKSSSMPRSVSKAFLSLLMPSALLTMICVFWSIRHRKKRQLLKRRLLLSVLIVLYISYIGLARRLFSVLYCVRIYDGVTVDNASRFLYWSQDTSVKCYEGSHALLLGIVTLPLILVVLLCFPIGSAILLFLARRKQALESVPVKETFGFMYQAYKEEYVFWDCTILLRKAALALVVTFGSSLDGNVQGLVALSIIGLSLNLQLNFSPFNKHFESLNSNEKFSLAVSFTTFLSGVFLNESSIPSGGRIFISVFALLANLSFILYSVFDIYSQIMKAVRLSLEHDTASADRNDLSLLFRWARNGCSKAFSGKRKKNRV